MDLASRGHDVQYSVCTLLLGTALTAGTTWLVLRGVIPLATTPPGAGRLSFEVTTYVLLFDAYFYGLHRLLHTPSLFRVVHAVHHRSTAPSIFTALAFHPLEALLILGFVPVAMWLLPIHLLSLAVVSTFLSGSIFLAHMARDPFPRWWGGTPVLRAYVTPRVHHVHHARRDCNYSATFSLFDRLFGTLHSDDAQRGRGGAAVG